MGLCAVICSKDERVLRILRSLLADLSIQAEFATSGGEAIECLARQKYDGIFADCDDPDGQTVLRAIRRSRHNQRSVAFVISPDGQWVAYVTDADTDGVDELYAVPITGTTPLKLNPPLVAGGSV